MPDGERQPTRRPPTAPAPGAAPEAQAAHRSAQETIAALLAALISLKPDPAAWTELKAIAAEHKERSNLFLATLLGQHLNRVEPERRPAIVDALAKLLVAQKINALLTGTLASDAELVVRHLSLAVMGYWKGPLDASLQQPLRGLILDRRLPLDAQVGAMTALLRSVGPDSLVAKEFLQKFTGGLGKGKSIERLRQLEERVGPNAAITALSGDLEERLRMTCPRCAAQLRKPDMEQHLLEAHGLVLDGRRVREPWSVIEDWAKSMRGKPDAEVMVRCQALASRIDPEHGDDRLQRLYVAAGVTGEETRLALREEARRHHRALCPACYAEVPVPLEARSVALEQRGGRLYANGFSVDLSEKGWQTTLEVRAPDRVIYHGREPRYRWTMNGARVLLVGSCVLLALMCGCWPLPRPGFLPQLPFALATAYLLVAVVMELVVRQVWKPRAPLNARVFDYTWRYLVPRLHAEGYRLDDSAFAAAIVQATPAGRSSIGRAPLLQELVQHTEAAVRDGQGPAEHLAALRRLLIADAVAAGADPVPLVLAQLARCFEGNLTLSYAEQLLQGWNANWWTPGNRARLRVLLCDRAFEAGFEVSDLIDSAKMAPSLAAVLEIKQPQLLTGLRYLWSLRASRPWDKFGETETIFEIAARAEGAALLVEFPDLLLVQQTSTWRIAGENGRGKVMPTRILLRLSGVMLQEVHYTAPANLIEQTERKQEFYLVLGKGLFRSQDNMDGLIKRMERWFRYWFSEFLPQAPSAQGWRALNRTAILRAWGAVACPECKRILRAKAGEVGVLVDEVSGKTE